MVRAAPILPDIFTISLPDMERLEYKLSFPIAQKKTTQAIQNTPSSHHYIPSRAVLPAIHYGRSDCKHQCTLQETLDLHEVSSCIFLTEYTSL